MQQQRKLSKRTNIEDLKLDRRAITKVVLPSQSNQSVIEFNVSMYVIPNQDCDIEYYEAQIHNIKKYATRRLREYVYSCHDVFDGKYIIDTNFTSANLKKGYNKSVQISLILKKVCDWKFLKLKRFIKKTIKPFVNDITNRIVEEDFKCHKRKQSINKDLKVKMTT
jgi:hypothetical protein